MNDLLQRLGRLATSWLLPRSRATPTLRARVYVTLYLFAKRITDRRECVFLRTQLKEGMTVLDVGANVGFYADLFAACVGGTGRVVCFEPDPLSVALLKERVKNRANVRVIEVALGNENGQATLTCSAENGANNSLAGLSGDTAGARYSVNVRRLDDLWPELGDGSIDVLKMDIQGAEVEALRGMLQTLKAHPPRLMLIEFAPSDMRRMGSDVRMFWNLLHEAGFGAFTLDDGGTLKKIEDPVRFTDGIKGEEYVNVVARRAEKVPAMGHAADS